MTPYKTPQAAAITIKTRTWGRAGNHRRQRSCPICKLPMEWGARYRYDTRTQVLWHVECEASPKFSTLQQRIAAMPTLVPTFPAAQA